MLKVSCDFHLSMGVSRKANYSILILVARPNPKLRIAVTPRHEIAVTPRHEQVSRGCKSCRGLVPPRRGLHWATWTPRHRWAMHLTLRTFGVLPRWAALAIVGCASVAVMCAWFIIIAGSIVAIGVLAFAIVIGAACMLTCVGRQHLSDRIS